MIQIFRKRIYTPRYLIGNYEIVKLIGEGRFGKCYLVNSDGKKYILKELKSKAIKKSREKIIFEEKILSAVNHPSVPKIYM